MASGFKILMPNDKDGLSSDGFFTCDMDNKIACLFKISRSQLERWKDRPEMKCSGVYLLLGAPEDEDKPVVYVGQAGFRNDGTTIYSRLQEHTNDYTKEYWSEAVFFYSKEDSLEFNHISYLENRFYNLVKSANRYAVKNKKEPNRGNISEQNKVAMDNYIEDVKAMMEVIGYKVFTPLVERKSKNAPVAVSNGDVEVFLERKVGGKFKAQGHAVWNSQGFIVLRRSVLSPDVSSAVSANVAQKRRQAKIENNVLMEDVCFTSPSGAASFVIGNAANGWTEWRSKDGVPLGKMLGRNTQTSPKAKSHIKSSTDEDEKDFSPDYDLQPDYEYGLDDDEDFVLVDDDEDFEFCEDDEGQSDGDAVSVVGSDDEREEPRTVFVYLSHEIEGSNVRVNAKGVYNFGTRHLTILPGSTVSPYVKERVRATVDFERGMARFENNVLQDNVSYTNPSRAAEFLIGDTANGLTEWKDERGVPLGDLLNANRQDSDAESDSQESVLPESDERDGDSYPAAEKEIKVFFRKARAVYDVESGQTTVLAGSSIYPITNEDRRSKIEKDRNRADIDGGVLKRDISFSSPSRAAEFVKGGTSNGWAEWRDEHRISLGKLVGRK